MSDRKPREFWIEKSSLGIFNAVEDKSKLNGWTQDNGPIHVIEKSAYDELQAKLEMSSGWNVSHSRIIKELRADLELAIEALKKTIMLLEVKNGLLVAYRTGGHHKESIWKKLPKCETALEDAKETLAKLQGEKK